MICLSRLVIINLPSVWPPKRSKDSEKKDSNASVRPVAPRDFQRPLQIHTKRGYIKWFNKLSRCQKTHHFPGRMHPRL
ncbi:uncharacterized protein LOC26526189 [Drosophila erecta]|uniref:Uncharacterized protein n=1 Tax=Drosophila erecta TaxID=7220 RepID=A0A0Q5UHV5_DROER|nr:uncharacterized protein LOC26526189 [Drosophila erecta]KQS43463.1 uncharacterized protein Dere_GG26365 [Drosophila erecta]